MPVPDQEHELFGRDHVIHQVMQNYKKNSKESHILHIVIDGWNLFCLSVLKLNKYFVSPFEWANNWLHLLK